MKRNKDINYLDLIPEKSRYTSSYTGEDGKFYVRFRNTGFYNRLAQLLFKRPQYTNIEMEKYGTFIWQYIDGENSVYDIALKVKERFGEEAEPLFDRICRYFAIMADNKLVILNKVKNN